MKLIQTSPAQNIFGRELTLNPGDVKPSTELRIVNVYPEVRYQEIIGFGGAFTESSAYNYSLLTPELIGTPDIRYDEAIVMNVLAFDGTQENLVRFNYKNNTEATEAIVDAFTFETYIRVDEIPAQNARKALIGANHNYTGFKLDIVHGKTMGPYFEFTFGRIVFVYRTEQFAVEVLPFFEGIALAEDTWSNVACDECSLNGNCT